MKQGKISILDRNTKVGKKEGLYIKGIGNTKSLTGDVFISGSKNGSIPAIASSFIFGDEFSISNTPNNSDNIKLLKIIKSIGGKVEQEGEKIHIDIGDDISTHISDKLMGSLRGTIVLTASILGRKGEVSFTLPGGCPLGERPIDLFIEGYKKMGAQFVQDGDRYILTAKNGLKGCEIFIQPMSVTVTEAMIIAGLTAKGETVLKNSSCEPEIQHIVDFLNSCGADIQGAGTPTIRIKGNGLLYSKGKTYNLIPDRIETGSFVILGVLAGHDIHIKNCIPEHIESLIHLLRKSGVDTLKIKKNEIIITKENKNRDISKNKSINVKTQEYPGFPTDLQPMIALYASQVSGESNIFETIFDNRFGYVEEIKQLGFNAYYHNRREIIVYGCAKMKGATVKPLDVRGSYATILATLISEGNSVLKDTSHISRGYEYIVEKINSLGGSISRIK